MLRKSRRCGLMITEWQYFISHDMSRLVAFTCDQQSVTFLETCDGSANGLSAIADLFRAFCSRHDRSADRCRIFRTGVVVGDNDSVSAFRSNGSHQRTLAAIAITARA